MNSKKILIFLSLISVLTAASFAQAALPAQSDSEIELSIQAARDNIDKQEAIVKSLRKRYENILKFKKQLQEFLDRENKRLKDAVELVKAKPQVKTASPQVSSPKREIYRPKEKAPEKARVTLRDKELQPGEQKLDERKAELERALEEQEKARAIVLKGREESRKKELQAQESERNKALEEKKRLEEKIKQQDLDLQRSKKMLEQELLAKKRQDEKDALNKKMEKQRILAQQEEQRLKSENECQKRLLLEAEKKAKHEKYVCQLEKLLNRQNYLMAETRQLENQIQTEEESLKILEKTRQDLIDKLLEKP
jgi:hypothetical protein